MSERERKTRGKEEVTNFLAKLRTVTPGPYNEAGEMRTPPNVSEMYFMKRTEPSESTPMEEKLALGPMRRPRICTIALSKMASSVLRLATAEKDEPTVDSASDIRSPGVSLHSFMCSIDHEARKGDSLS